MYVKVTEPGNVSSRGTLYACQGHKTRKSFLSADSLCMSMSQNQEKFLVGGLLMYVNVTKLGKVSCRGTFYVHQGHKTR